MKTNLKWGIFIMQLLLLTKLTLSFLQKNNLFLIKEAKPVG